MSENGEMPEVPIPFEDPRADVVFKTSDGVEIRSYKVLLSLASPVFETMFDLPQSAEGLHPPTVEVQDRSKELVNALRWIDHRVMPSLAVPDLLDALLVADKYEMTYTLPRILKALAEALKGNINDEEVLRIFAIAYKLRLEDLLQRGARRTLSMPIRYRPLVQEFELIPATALHQLMNYYNTCKRKIQLGSDIFRDPPYCALQLLLRSHLADYPADDSDEKLSNAFETYIFHLFKTYLGAWVPLRGEETLAHAKNAEKCMAKCSGYEKRLEGFRELQSEVVIHVERLLDDVIYQPGWPLGPLS